MNCPCVCVTLLTLYKSEGVNLGGYLAVNLVVETQQTTSPKKPGPETEVLTVQLYMK